MAKQIQIKRQPKPKDNDSADAPTTNKSIAKLWFSGE